MKAFADISGDHNPLHFDEQYAAGTRFKRPIVFGVLMNAYVADIHVFHTRAYVDRADPYVHTLCFVGGHHAAQVAVGHPGREPARTWVHLPLAERQV